MVQGPKFLGLDDVDDYKKNVDSSPMTPSRDLLKGKGAEIKRQQPTKFEAVPREIPKSEASASGGFSLGGVGKFFKGKGGTIPEGKSGTIAEGKSGTIAEGKSATVKSGKSGNFLETPNQKDIELQS